MPDFPDEAPGTAMTGPAAPAPEPASGDPQAPGQPAGSVTTAIPPQCPTRTRIYRRGELLDVGFPAEQLSERLAADQDTATWLDLDEPTEADLQIVTGELGLHPLAVEDAISPRQRPKVDRYRTHLFASRYAVCVSELDIDALIAYWDLNARLADSSNQVSCLTYGLLDAQPLALAGRPPRPQLTAPLSGTVWRMTHYWTWWRARDNDERSWAPQLVTRGRWRPG